MTTYIEFRIDQNDDRSLRITPFVDAVSFADLVERFEQEAGFNDPAGGYGGIVPDYFRYGALDEYFSGQHQWGTEPAHGRAAILTCECGEFGCWPSWCSIVVTDNSIVWSNFSQPHRPERDYSQFGPFNFELQQYQRALSRLIDELETAKT